MGNVARNPCLGCSGVTCSSFEGRGDFGVDGICIDEVDPSSSMSVSCICLCLPYMSTYVHTYARIHAYPTARHRAVAQQNMTEARLPLRDGEVGMPEVHDQHKAVLSQTRPQPLMLPGFRASVERFGVLGLGFRLIRS